MTHPRPRARGALLALVALACAAGPATAAPDSPAVRRLKQALGNLGRVEGGVAAGHPTLVEAGEAIEAVGEQDDADAARLLIQVLLTPLGSASVEVFAFDRARAALAGMSSPAAHEEVRATLDKRKRDPRVAVALAQVVSAYREPASAEALGALLAQRDARIATAAARGLGQLGTKEAIPPLVAHFGTWQQAGGEPIEAIGDALFALTGQGFTSQADWEKWWGGVAASFDPAQRNQNAGGTRERPPLQSEVPKMWDSVEVTSKRVVIVLDVSGSMHIKNFVEEPGENGTASHPPLPAGDPRSPGYTPRKCAFGQCPGAKGTGPDCGSDDALPDHFRRLDRLARQTTLVVRRLRPDVQFNMVAFSTDARPWRGTTLVEASERNKRAAIEWLQGLQPSGATNALAALEQAFEFQDADHIIFVTDGAPTNSAGKPIEPAAYRELLDEVKRLNKLRNVVIDVIAITGGHTDFAVGLARENGGEYVTVE